MAERATVSIKDTERFLEKLDTRSLGCWEWKAGKQQGGYGQFRLLGSTRAASRAAYELFIGPIPEGHQVCHRCDNPSCARPSHLFTDTAQGNATDKVAKGRSTYGARNPNSKLSDPQVDEIRNSSASVKELCALYGISAATVSRVKNKKLWKHVN